MSFSKLLVKWLYNLFLHVWSLLLATWGRYFNSKNFPIQLCGTNWMPDLNKMYKTLHNYGLIVTESCWVQGVLNVCHDGSIVTHCAKYFSANTRPHNPTVYIVWLHTHMQCISTTVTIPEQWLLVWESNKLYEVFPTLTVSHNLE